MSDFNYGKGYGDWHKYAGQTDKNSGEFTFGGDPSVDTSPVAPVVPPTQETTVNTGAIAPPTMGLKPIDTTIPKLPTTSSETTSLLDAFKQLGGY
jgi:hypothetical protein